MCVVVVIATRPKVLDVLCIQHKHTKTMEDMETMVYLVLGPQLFVRQGFFVLCFVQPFPSLPGYKNCGLGCCEEVARVTHQVT